MCHVLYHAHQVLSQWIQQHPDSFPPIVIHISDGESQDGDPIPYAEAVRNLATNDGNVLLFNCHLSMTPGRPVHVSLGARWLARRVGPSAVQHVQRVARDRSTAAPWLKGIALQPGARGMAFNADMVVLVKFLDMGTRALAVVNSADNPHRRQWSPCMIFEHRAFWLPKDVQEPKAYEDAFQVDGERGMAAVCDGVVVHRCSPAAGPASWLKPWSHEPPADPRSSGPGGLAEADPRDLGRVDRRTVAGLASEAQDAGRGRDDVAVGPGRRARGRRTGSHARIASGPIPSATAACSTFAADRYCRRSRSRRVPGSKRIRK